MGLIGEDTEDDVGEKANMSHNSDWFDILQLKYRGTLNRIN